MVSKGESYGRTMDNLQNDLKFFLSGNLFYGGGGERIALQVSEYLSNHSSMRLSLLDNAVSTSEKRWEIDQIKINVEYQSVKYENKNILKFLYQQMPDVSEYSKSGINLVMIYRVPSKRYLKQLILNKIPIVFLIHGISFEKVRFSNLTLFLYQIYLRVTLIWISNILQHKNFKFQVLTRDAVSVLRKWGKIKERQIFLVENGSFPPKIDYHFTTSNYFDILFIGRMSNLQKGLKLLVKVGKRLDLMGLPNLRIIVIGSGPDSRLLADAAKNYNLITYLGFVDEKKKHELLEKGSLMLCTSNLDPFPIATLEALQMGLPVITVPLSGPKNMVNKNKIFGKVSGYSPKSIVNDVLTFYRSWYENREEYSIEKVNRAKIARNEFNMQNMLEGYLQLVEKSYNDFEKNLTDVTQFIS